MLAVFLFCVSSVIAAEEPTPRRAEPSSGVAADSGGHPSASAKPLYTMRFSMRDMSVECYAVRSLWKVVDMAISQAVGDGELRQNVTVEPAAGKKDIFNFRVSQGADGMRLTLAKDTARWLVDETPRRNLIELVLLLKAGASPETKFPGNAQWLVDALDRRIGRLLDKDRPVPIGGSFLGVHAILSAGGRVSVDEVMGIMCQPEDGPLQRLHAEKAEILLETVAGHRNGAKALLEYLKALVAGADRQDAMERLCGVLFAEQEANVPRPVKAAVEADMKDGTAGIPPLPSSERLTAIFETNAWRLAVNSYCPLPPAMAKKELGEVMAEKIRFALKEPDEKDGKEKEDKEKPEKPVRFEECVIEELGEKWVTMKRPVDAALDARTRILNLYGRMPYYLQQPVEEVYNAVCALQENGNAKRFKRDLSEARRKFDAAAVTQQAVDDYLREQERKHVPPCMLYQPRFEALEELRKSKLFAWPTIEEYLDKEAKE